MLVNCGVHRYVSLTSNQVIMNKRQRRVFALLKTKCKALGFNRKELEGLALNIDGNLELEDDALDEDVDAAISKAIDAALPFLQVSQSAASRSAQQSIRRLKEKYGLSEDDEEDEDSSDNEDVVERQTPRMKQTKKAQNAADNELKELLRKQSEAIEGLKGQLAQLQGDRVKETRRTKLKKLVDGTGTFGKSIVRQFNQMTFNDDDAFEDFLADVQQDLDDLNQERANDGLGKLGAVPVAGKKGGEDQRNNVLSDADVIALAGGAETSK